MELICPNCYKAISTQDVNVVTDVAKCAHCNSLHRVSNLLNKTTVQAPSDRPPVGSKIQMKKGLLDNVELFVPAKGVSAMDIPIIVFAGFWISFVAFWTWGASQASVLFAMFSIPFWFVGIAMLGGVINSIKETQTIQITGDRLTLIKSRVFNSQNIEFRMADIQAVRFTTFKGNPFSAFSNMGSMRKPRNSNRVAIEQPAIVSGATTSYFFENLNEVEQEWATAYIDAIVQKHR